MPPLSLSSSSANSIEILWLFSSAKRRHVVLTASVAGVCLISHLALQLKSSIETPNMALWRERWPVKSVLCAGASICNEPWSKIPFMGVPVLVEYALWEAYWCKKVWELELHTSGIASIDVLSKILDRRILCYIYRYHVTRCMVELRSNRILCWYCIWGVER